MRFRFAVRVELTRPTPGAIGRSSLKERHKCSIQTLRSSSVWLSEDGGQEMMTTTDGYITPQADTERRDIN